MAALTLTRTLRPNAPVEVKGCQGCGACLLTCPEHAIRPLVVDAGPARLVVLADHCTGCGQCVEVCPVDAITFTSPGPPRRLSRYDARHGEAQ